MIPEDLLYTNEHEWVKIDGSQATVGITEHAQEQLGEITFVELPAVGQKLEAKAVLGTIESSKAAGDIYCPVAGEVTEVNERLEAQPELINKSCYDEGWICKLNTGSEATAEGLMTAQEYEQYLKGLE